MSALNSVRLTMTSLEIATVVESRHDKVKQSIERLAERGVITLPPLGEVSNPGRGRKLVSVYELGKRDSLVVVAQLCPEFTAKIVDRWQELEDQVATVEKSLQQKVWALDAKEAESKAKAGQGSKLLHARKHELQQFRIERAELEAQYQPSLLK